MSRAATLQARADAAQAKADALKIEALRAAMVEVRGSIRAAAVLLGWGERQVSRKLDEYGLTEWNRATHDLGGRQPTKTERTPDR